MINLMNIILTLYKLSINKLYMTASNQVRPNANPSPPLTLFPYLPLGGMWKPMASLTCSRVTSATCSAASLPARSTSYKQ